MKDRFRSALSPLIFASSAFAFQVMLPSAINAHHWPWQVDWNDRLSFAEATIHQRSHSFIACRIMVLGAVQGLTKWAHLSAYVALVGIELFFWLMMSLFLEWTRQSLFPKKSSSETARLWTQICFFSSFTLLFAFVSPIETWSEPFQYTFLFASMAFLTRSRWVSALLFGIACFERETSFLILPGLLYFANHLGAVHSENWIEKLRRSFPFLLSGVPALLWYLVCPIPDDPGRFKFWRLNFSDRAAVLETLFSVIFGLGIPFILALNRRSLDKSEEGRRESCLLRCFWLTVILNTPLACIAGVVHEARLVALPLLFLWPCAGEWMRQSGLEIRRRWAESNLLLWGVSGIAAALPLIWFNQTGGPLPWGAKVWGAAFFFFSSWVSFRGRSPSLFLKVR